MCDDFKHWKLEKIVKVPSEQDSIKAVFSKHYKQLKEIYLQACCQYRPPNINYTDFLNFLSIANVTDSVITPGTIGVYFREVNFGAEEMEENDNRTLCRFEFMEILVRIAKGKYVEHGRMTNLAEAFEKLLIEHILPMSEKLVPWQAFRDNHMWNLPVNDLLMINMRKQKKLYQAIAELKEFKHRYNRTRENFRVATIDQILAFLSNTLPNVLDKHYLKCFHLSKMTRIQPMLESEESFTFLKWVEFLEFVPRLAHFMFKSTP